ncbi:helix-turn-helix domain-containing protein [Desulfonatronovibrio magnus]|uniref:helix-turn-helix domain-containing protein n=1 Tax=Desulfonatronovibrio magnus TaxID=698827 RepID=UPI0005EAE136|nr:helix-turn-helix transcriptional regulator [Desulfonatronovibrio magnus]
MQAQKMAHTQVSIPVDNLELLTALVNKLGGQVSRGIHLDSFCDPMPNVERGGNMLKALRRRACLTQNEVAKDLGIPQSHISEFERDKRNIPYKHALKLAKLMNTLPGHFMKPNSETLEAISELGKGKGERFNSAEKLFENLDI